jgi:fructose-specific phosphotransferase system IIC component
MKFAEDSRPSCGEAGKPKEQGLRAGAGSIPKLSGHIQQTDTPLERVLKGATEEEKLVRVETFRQKGQRYLGLERGYFCMIFFKGIGCLVIALILFSLFSMKAPKGSEAMSGLAGAAVATFLVEALYGCVGGDVAGIAFLAQIGESSGSMGGVAAAILVPLMMGANPVFAVVAGAAVGGYGILPGFLAGYAVYFLSLLIKKYVPAGVDVIAGALVIAIAARGIAAVTSPFVTEIIANIGDSIIVATEQSPIVMGFILGGIMKMVCTSPLSAMALTAMLNLTGLPMGIASIACFGGAFSDGTVFARLGLGRGGQVAAVMMEPLTQADIVTKNPLPLYSSNFIGGGLSGIVAVVFGIISNAPGTSSPIPGMLVPFAFNPATTVLMALGCAALCGVVAGFAGSAFYGKTAIGRKLWARTGGNVSAIEPYTATDTEKSAPVREAVEVVKVTSNAAR